MGAARRLYRSPGGNGFWTLNFVRGAKSEVGGMMDSISRIGKQWREGCYYDVGLILVV